MLKICRVGHVTSAIGLYAPRPDLAAFRFRPGERHDRPISWYEGVRRLNSVSYLQPSIEIVKVQASLGQPILILPYGTGLSPHSAQLRRLNIVLGSPVLAFLLRGRRT